MRVKKLNGNLKRLKTSTDPPTKFKNVAIFKTAFFSQLEIKILSSRVQ